MTLTDTDQFESVQHPTDYSFSTGAIYVQLESLSLYNVLGGQQHQQSATNRAAWRSLPRQFSPPVTTL